MSAWKFILIDREGLRIEVPEPIDWIDPEVVVARDHDNGWHGVFFDYGFNKLTFTDLGATLIKAEYEEYGVNGEMRVDILFQCSEDNRYDPFYENGRIAFDQYSDTCGDECTVSVGIEDSSDIMLFKNNYEQSVNLNSNIAFDQETILSDYDWLNKDIVIPNRGLPQAVGGNSPGTQHSVYPIEVRLLTPIAGTAIRIRPELTENSISEIADADPVGSNSYQVFPQTSPNLYPTSLSPILELNETVSCSSGVFDYTVRLKGHIKEQATNLRQIRIFIVVINEPWADIGDTTLHQVEILPETTFTPGVGPDMDFDQSFSGSCVIEEGNPFIAFINFVTYYGTTVDQFVWVDWDAETSIKISTVSNCAATDAKSYMINEAVSRTIEAITNDNIRFYSSTFGRVDSQPYAINYDPCPGLFSITDGLNIRRKLLIDNSQPGFFTNMKKLFSGLNGMWNIGLTIEADPNRVGHNRLRFEDWRFFYQDDISIRFLYPTKITRSVDVSRLYNSMKAGYNKWEAEGTTGLYELMTIRNYRININAISKELDITTDIICSPYTIETTRRLATTTEDWKYDNDVFGFCLKRIAGGFAVELFLDNAVNVTNVIDPNTAYNAIITPERNAMRWFNYIMQGLRNLKPDSKLIFSNGTGNYIASLQTTSCNIEGKTLAENEDIDVTDFEDIDDALPLTYPELVTFEHPMNYNTFKRIKDDPTVRYKSVAYTCNGTEYEGWIDKMSYKPITGMANITLIPKNNSIAQLPDPSCAASVSDIVFDSPGDGQMTIDWTESTAGATFWQIILTRNGASYNTINVSYHPININGLPTGDYNVVVIPYCDNNLPGTNYVQGDFTISLPTFALELSAILTTGRQPNNKLQLTATGNVGAPAGFSFKFGQCTFNTSAPVLGEACRAFPRATIPPPTAPSGIMSYNTGDTNKMVESVYTTPGSDFGYITKVVLYDLVGITAAQITKAVGQTWTLVFL